MRYLVFGQHDRGAAERISLNHVAADFEKAGMNFLDGFGLADKQGFRAAFELRTAVVIHGQVLRVQIGAHRAIKDDDAFAKCVEKVSHPGLLSFTPRFSEVETTNLKTHLTGLAVSK